jgi:APA family basic amino acid/polyamine antiporter
MIRVGPRVLETMGEDYRALGWFAARNRHGVPERATLFQAALSLVLVATGAFEGVLIFAQFSLLLCTFLAALGVILLRKREPSLPRPYRTWGYPATPGVFLGITLWMMVYVVRERPLESLGGLGAMVLGLAVYVLPSRVSSWRLFSQA